MNLSFIKLDINIMNDTKIKLIRKLPDGDSILVLWIGLLCLGMKSGKPGTLEIGDGIPFTDEALSIELDIPINTVRLGLKTFIDFRMIEVWEDGSTYLTNFEKHQELEKIMTAKEKSRVTSKTHRDKMKLTMSDGHVINSDKTDIEEDKDKKEDKDIKDPKEKTNKFIKPSVEEIEAYCTERNNGIDPETFFNHYESIGWLRGKNKIKNWKSCVITWEKNQKKQPNDSGESWRKAL